MKTENRRRELEQFTRKWPLDAHYFIWGTSTTANYLCDLIGGEFVIDGFVDSDSQKWGSQFRGRPVFSPEEYITCAGDRKLIVASGAYSEIRAALRSDGRAEWSDFCDSRYFLSAHMMVRENRLILARTDLSVTEYCNLRCKHCNMLMPYFKHPKHRDLEHLKEDIDTYFKWVDGVQIFNLLGGEPFLYPDVFALTKYLCEQYGHHINQIVFFSNGTILPPENLLMLMSKYNIEIQISDYRKGLPHLADKIDTFKASLERYNIRFRHGVDDQWISFGFPNYQRPLDWDGDPISFFDECYAPFRGLYQKRLYYCHLEASAEAAGLFVPSSNDYFDLSIFDETRKVELAGFDLGYTETGDISYCARCKGCFSVNQNYIPVAEQQER